MLRHGFFTVQDAAEDKKFRDDKPMLLDKEMLQRFCENPQPLESRTVATPLHTAFGEAFDAAKAKAKGGFQPFRMFNNALTQSADRRTSKGQVTPLAKGHIDSSPDRKNKLATAATQPNTQSSGSFRVARRSSSSIPASHQPPHQKEDSERSSSFLMRGISFPSSNLIDEACRAQPVPSTFSEGDIDCFSSNMDVCAIPRVSGSDPAGLSTGDRRTSLKKNNKLTSYSFDMFAPRDRSESTPDQMMHFSDQLRRPITAQSKAKTGTSLKKSRMLRKGSVSASKKNATTIHIQKSSRDNLFDARLASLISLRPAKRNLNEDDSVELMCQKIQASLPMQYKEVAPGTSMFCFRADHFIVWATAKDVRSKAQAVELGNRLIQGGGMINASSEDQTFRSDCFYALTETSAGSASSETEMIGSRSSGSIQWTSMSELLQDTEGVEALYQFLSKEYCEEVLLFVLCVVGFRDTADSKESIETQALEIFDTFILPEAKLQINISQQLYDDVTASKDTNTFSLEMFDVVEKEMITILERDKFPRFKKEYFATAKQGLTRTVGTIQ